MSPFLKHAEEIFEVACQGGAEDCDLAILVGPDGTLHMLPAAGWALDSLRVHQGARAAYRVRRAGGRVTLEARCGGAVCRLESGGPAHALRTALADCPRYATIQ